MNMEFFVKNWWYLLVAGGFAFMMFRGCGCCGSSFHGVHVKKNEFASSEDKEEKENT